MPRTFLGIPHERTLKKYIKGVFGKDNPFSLFCEVILWGDDPRNLFGGQRIKNIYQ